MKLHGFKERLIVILNKTISDIEEAKELVDDPFSERQYENQQQYEKFIDTLGIDDLLFEMKKILAKLKQ